jgi:hypothetical protein
MVQRNFATPISIASIGVNTLSGPQFRWICAQDWSESQTSYYGLHKASNQSGLVISPKKFRRVNKYQSPGFAAWILTDRSCPEAPIAWAEAHQFGGSIATIHLFWQSDGVLREGDIEFLMSAIFLVTSCDVIDVWALGEVPTVAPWATMAETLIVKQSPFELKPQLRMQATQQSWWSFPGHEDHRSQLKHLARRPERPSRSKYRAAPRGLVSRLFSLRRR